MIPSGSMPSGPLSLERTNRICVKVIKSQVLLWSQTKSDQHKGAELRASLLPWYCETRLTTALNARHSRDFPKLVDVSRLDNTFPDHTPCPKSVVSTVLDGAITRRHIALARAPSPWSAIFATYVQDGRFSSRAEEVKCGSVANAAAAMRVIPPVYQSRTV